jgi:hypothetical protein
LNNELDLHQTRYAQWIVDWIFSSVSSLNKKPQKPTHGMFAHHVTFITIHVSWSDSLSRDIRCRQYQWL